MDQARLGSLLNAPKQIGYGTCTNHHCRCTGVQWATKQVSRRRANGISTSWANIDGWPRLTAPSP